MLSSIADIAEIIASIGVILSLLFVGFQMREGNRSARMNAIQASWQQEMDISSKLADHAATWARVVAGKPPADDEESRRAIGLYNLLMAEAANRFVQYQEGYLLESDWQGRRATLDMLVKLPVYRDWRDSIVALNYPNDFITLLDNLRATG